MITKFEDYIKENEGGGGVAAASAASTSGMGSVVSAQPSSNAGQTISPGYEAGGGSVGSGDYGVPFGGVSQKIGAYGETKKKKKKKKKKSKKNEEAKPMIGFDIVTSFGDFEG
jgi:hypothetical protein